MMLEGTINQVQNFVILLNKILDIRYIAYIKYDFGLILSSKGEK